MKRSTLSDNPCDLNQLCYKVLKWGEERGILAHSTPLAQFSKTLEEVAELKAALKADNLEEIKDGIGDVLVTLILVADLRGTSIAACLQQAYDEIKVRTGYLTKEGVFVKDGDSRFPTETPSDAD